MGGDPWAAYKGGPAVATGAEAATLPISKVPKLQGAPTETPGPGNTGSSESSRLMPRPLTGIQQRAYDLGIELPVAGSATKELVSWAHRQGRMIHRYCSVATPAEGREIANALEVGMAGREQTWRSEVTARGKSVERQLAR